jgi:pimeloyl-ACP methyl ester carboxylesterase
MSSPRRYPAYELAFREWVVANGYGLVDLSYPRAPGRCHAVLMGTARPYHAVAVVAHATGNDKFFPLVEIHRLLLKLGLAVFAFDLDGHGRESSHTLNVAQADTMLEFALTEARERVQGKPFHLIGQSLGALLVMRHLATRLQMPKDYLSATLISPPVSGRILARQFWREGLSFLKPGWRRAVSTYGTLGTIPAFGPVKRGTFPLRLAEGYASWSVRSYAGQDDVLTPPQQAEVMTRRIKLPSELHLIPNETHFTTPMSATCLELMKRWPPFTAGV